ncbi:Putative 10 TMS drug/metabolite exporter, DME family, DMT superfamily [Thermogladius calderae 1633]|uniref:Putative 10 TMS drug/metabolite exporter, DME family, DMT superfamily n=1 Tax=Thermogladius calderae (strain DSM 22663 / VKM B-2946 / 1633) TaxID=1184251 RepID=I3TGA4_THEC1|nr:DMT family transporter [Thermogladius calderae]AFK51792.1 Putative 10 TMS drug/metabolite exporter, DME family, DMT superfamily [Thermogladius calderae 1633]
MRDRVKGLLALLATSLIWGSSFVFIKLSVSDIDGVAYTFYRSLIALALLTPALLLGRSKFNKGNFRKGFVVGLSYVSGLALQGVGTQFTTPSISAFVTGLNTVFVYIYEFLRGTANKVKLVASLALSTIGLYLLTEPAGELGLGVVLVLIGAIAWAAEIVLVGVYSAELTQSTISFLYGLLLPGLFITPYVALHANTLPSLNTVLYIFYLSLFCTIIASVLQVVGQKYVPAYAAATIYLLEPISAAVFSALLYGERLSPIQVVGASLIILAIYIVSK